MTFGSLETSQSAGDWIPLMDYAMKKGVSLSTLRRYIKANKIPFRVENGRYLLPDEAGIEVEAHRMPVAQIMPERDNAQTDLRLKMELQKAREEIAELKTLIAFYEERIPGPRLDV